jgi:hypothetical protein
MSAGLQQRAPENITISGIVRDYSEAPINAIKVSVYRNTGLVEHAYTNESGRYEVTIPSGEPVTILFDTHPTLTNAREWHPSVVANLSAQQSLVLDRHLVGVGNTGGDVADVDALAGYQFAALFIDRDPGSIHDLYSGSAADRISELKLPVIVLQKVWADIKEFFFERRT